METYPFWMDDEAPGIGIDQLLLASRQWSSRRRCMQMRTSTQQGLKSLLNTDQQAFSVFQAVGVLKNA